MRLYETHFKNIHAVAVESDQLRAVFLPLHGGKLASLTDLNSGHEWLAQDDNPHYIPQTLTSSYVDCEVSGADDMFPTIDPCMGYPCHGEVCRVQHDFHIEGNSLYTSYHSKQFGYMYQKRITPKADGSISIHHSISNFSDHDLHCLWAFHMMLAAVENGRIITPYCDEALAEIMFDETGEFGSRGTKFSVSADAVTSRKFSPCGNTYKLYFDAPISQGRCGYFHPLEQKVLVLNYDSGKLPYLGIWMNNGMFKQMYSAALEPCTIPYDSPVNAAARGYMHILKKQQTESFELSLQLQAFCEFQL